MKSAFRFLLVTGCILAVAAFCLAQRGGDPIEGLLVTLGRRGVNMDAELVKLNDLAALRGEPQKARPLYLEVKAALEAKEAAFSREAARKPDDKLIAQLAAGKDRVLAVTAHPDDENMMSGLLAFAHDHGCAVRLLCLTRGEQGENPHSAGLRGDALGEKRAEELRGATSALGIEYRIADFRNGAFRAKFPDRKLWLPADVLAAWDQEPGPERVVADEARDFAATVILTIEPNWGWTGHAEHRAAAELARRAARQLGAQLAYAVTSDAAFTDAFATATTARPADKAQTYWALKLAAARRHESQFRLPATAEAHPEQARDLSTEHFLRVAQP
ncbi:MAG: PIG-L family deacetylase [Planctomycetes bacterium]|nr:PIG-L family deacetylase [Planctomycetota bacterium]